MRFSKNVLFRASFVLLLLPLSVPAAESQNQTALPVEKLLKADGTLDLGKGYKGSLDPKGWRMVQGANGQPKFVRDSKAGEVKNLSPDQVMVAGDENWDDRFGFPGPGLNGIVNSIAVSGSEVYVGGGFTQTGNIRVNYIAKWDGSTWSSLGSGVNNHVSAIAVSGSDVYVGGGFTKAGGVEVKYIAKWNGSTWSSLGSGLNGGVYAVAVSGSDIYVGGNFTQAGGIDANYIAKWNGSTWSSLGSGLNGGVSAVAVSGSDVYVGGDFTIAGSINANHIAKWNGSAWTSLGSGINGICLTIAVSGTALYVGGHFTQAGNVSANQISKWDGSTWSSLGSGLNGCVYTIAVSGSDVYVGGASIWAGYYITKWNGSTWSSLGSWLNNAVRVITVNGSDIYVGGDFTQAGNLRLNYIAKWDGNAWHTLGNLFILGNGLNNFANAIAVSGSNVYVGGNFTQAGNVPVNCIVKWDGSTWSSLGNGVGINGGVYAIAVSGSNVYIGGGFTWVGNDYAFSIAKWDGSTWSSLGSGINGIVYALAVNGSDVYVGGYFTQAGGVSANNIARWDGSNWSSLGDGVDNWVYSITIYNNDVYAGGIFRHAGNQEIPYLARWDGSIWHTVGDGFVENAAGVTSLAVSEGDLYVGGFFGNVAHVNANNVAKWNGSSWSALGNGVIADILSISVNDGYVYVGGFEAYGKHSPFKWDGNNWTELGSGISKGFGAESVYAIAVSGKDVYVGGDFSMAGGKPASYFSIWHEPPLAPEFVIEPLSCLAGSAFSFHPEVKGFPEPTISLVSGPTGMMYDAQTNTIHWTPNASQCGNQQFTLQAVNEAGTVRQTYTVKVDDGILLFSDDFESYPANTYPDNNWTTLFSGSSGQVSSEVSNSGSKSFELKSIYNWVRIEAHPMSSFPDHFAYEGWVYIAQAGKGAVIGLGRKLSFNQYLSVNSVFFNDWGTITFGYSPSGSSQNLQYWTPQTWYKITVLCDLVLNKATVCINDIIYGETFEIVGTEQFDEFSIRGMNFSNSDISKVYFDDIKLYNMNGSNDIIKHNNNRTRLSVFNNGILGARAGADASEGDVGFEFMGKNALFEGDLVIGKSATQVSGGLFNHEFGPLSPVVPIPSYLNGFEQTYQAKFYDQKAPNPIGVSIVQRSSSKSTDPDRDYVILDYWIKNSSGSALTGIYAGLAMDWDVGDAQKNLGGYDAVRKLNYMYESGGSTNSNYYGVAALQGDVSGSVIWLNGSDDNSDAVLFDRMTHINNENETVPYDRRAMLSVGPYSIPAGDSVRCVFALVGGRNLDELKTNAEKASAVIVPPVIDKTSWKALLTVTGSNGITITRTFGGDPKGTDGLDANLDVLSPPLPPTYNSSFQIEAFPNYLSTDIRNWEPPYQEANDWKLLIQNAENITTTLSWNPSDLPSQGSFTLIGAGTNVNMRTTKSATFTGNRTLAIQYRTTPVSMTYNFTKAGWHLVSLNVVPQDSSVITLFPAAQGNKAFIWDPSSRSYSAVTKMAPRKAYWINLSNSATCTVTGTPLTRYTTHFSEQGWYMIGSAAGEINFTNPNDDPDGSVLSPVFGWDATSGSYIYANKLNEKKGYWAAILGVCDLTVGPAQGLAKPSSEMDWDAFYRNCGNTPPGPPNLENSTFVEDMSAAPSAFGLMQNYPNPFNAETRFKYTIPEAVDVKWSVYDANGRKVFERNEGKQTAGTHSIVWNAISCPSGMYVVHFSAGTFSQIRKCVLLK